MRYRLLTLFMLITLLGIAFAIWQHRVELEAQRQQRIKNATASLLSFSSFDIGDDPVSLVRLLNELIALGQDDCTHVLRNYDSNDASSSELTGVLVPLLFSPRNGGLKYPSADYSKKTMRFTLTEDGWQNLDVEIFDEIPFGMDCLTDMSSGMGFKQSHLVDWAESTGAIRSNAIHPTDNPFATADHVAMHIIEDVTTDDRIQFEITDADREKITIRVREQVYSMLEDILDIDNNRYRDIKLSDKIWLQTQEQCSGKCLHWEPSTQQYAFSDK